MNCDIIILDKGGIRMDEKFELIASRIILYGGIVAILLPIILIIIAVLYNKRIKNTKIKQVCKYLDTFYYTHVTHDNSSLIMYHIISDLATSKIYAIPDTSLQNIKLDKSKEVFDMIISKSGKKCIEGTKVYFWIDKEESNWYKRDGNSVIIRKQKLIYTNEPDNCVYTNFETPKLYNINKKYDISLLDKAVLAYGYAEFVDEDSNQ